MLVKLDSDRSKFKPENDPLGKQGIMSDQMMKDFKNSNDSLLRKCFTWLVLKRIKCNSCKFETRKYHKMVCLDFEISPKEYHLSKQINNQFKKAQVYEKEFKCEQC